MNSILVKLNVALQEAEVLIESLKKQKMRWVFPTLFWTKDLKN